MKTVLTPQLVNKAVDIYATTPNVQHKDVADELFTSLGIFEIISIIAVHESYIDTVQVYNQP